MASFKDMWNKAASEEVKVFQTEDLPEGTYFAEVVSCKMGKTKAGDKDMISWDLKLVEGEQKNKHIWQHRPFSTTDTSEANEKAIERAINDFKLLALPCGADVINQTMIDVVGKCIEVSIKNGTNGQFKNFKRIVEAPVTIETGDSPF